MDDYVVDKGPVPDDQIKLVTGQIVFEEEQNKANIICNWILFGINKINPLFSFMLFNWIQSNWFVLQQL